MKEWLRELQVKAGAWTYTSHREKMREQWNRCSVQVHRHMLNDAHVYTVIHMHPQIYTHRHIYKHACIGMHIHTDTQTCKRTHTDIQSHIHTYRDTQSLIQIHIHAGTGTPMHAHTNTRHTHRGVCILANGRLRLLHLTAIWDSHLMGIHPMISSMHVVVI